MDDSATGQHLSADGEPPVEDLIHPLSRCAFLIETWAGASMTGTGTAFLYGVEGRTFLVTAGHVVTAQHADTGSSLGHPPDRLVVHPVLRSGPSAVVSGDGTVLLYNDDGSPKWFRHPDGLGVDVAVVEVTFGSPELLLTVPVNDACLEGSMHGFNVRAGHTAFILGFPEGITGGGGMPIWKRASVATEPSVVDSPYYVVDTATRPGMSGAPVMAQHVGVVDRGGILLSGAWYRFFGIYTAREQHDATGVRAQLGRVVKQTEVHRTVMAGVAGW